MKQNFNTNDMAHKIPRCIEWVTAIHTLDPGDTVEPEIAALARLTIKLRDDLQRPWSRTTRLARQNQGFDTPTPQVSGT